MRNAPAVARETAYDALRGLFLLVMAIDHMGGAVSFITYRTFGYVTAAEGFVLLSGFVFGLIYTRHLASDPGRLWTIARARAQTLWLWHLALIAVIAGLLALVPVLRHWWETHDIRTLSMSQPDAGSLLRLALFIDQPKYLDILPMYLAFLLLAPLILLAVHRGYLQTVVCLSGGVWLATQFQPQPFSTLLGYPFKGFNILAWQVLFVGGLVLGTLKASNRAPTDLLRGWLLRLAAGVAVLLLLLQKLDFLQTHGVLHLEWLRQLDLENTPWLEKVTLAPVNALNTGCAVVLLAWLLHRRAAWFRIRPLAFLGRYSLQVYCAHVPLVYVLRAYREMLEPAGILAKLAFDAGITILLVATLFLVAWACQSVRTPAAMRVPRAEGASA